MLELGEWKLFNHNHILQGSKLGGAGSQGLSWILLGLPQISAGSPKMYWFLYTTPLGSFWRCNWAPWKKKLNFKPCSKIRDIQTWGTCYVPTHLLNAHCTHIVETSPYPGAKYNNHEGWDIIWLPGNTCTWWRPEDPIPLSSSKQHRKL